MAQELKTTYGGVEISYVENRNVWLFELRGRERSAESLAKAKEAIDKPEPKDKKPFTRVRAHKFAPWEGWKVLDVTSVAESSYSGVDVWTTDSKKNRSKISPRQLYADTPSNLEAIKSHQELDRQVEALKTQQLAILSEMEHLKIE